MFFAGVLTVGLAALFAAGITRLQAPMGRYLGRDVSGIYRAWAKGFAIIGLIFTVVGAVGSTLTS
jgi:hypothetical protein